MDSSDSHLDLVESPVLVESHVCKIYKTEDLVYKCSTCFKM
jgi:hypothetical protein